MTTKIEKWKQRRKTAKDVRSGKGPDVRLHESYDTSKFILTLPEHAVSFLYNLYVEDKAEYDKLLEDAPKIRQVQDSYYSNNGVTVDRISDLRDVVETDPFWGSKVINVKDIVIVEPLPKDSNDAPSQRLWKMLTITTALSNWRKGEVDRQPPGLLIEVDGAHVMGMCDYSHGTGIRSIPYIIEEFHNKFILDKTRKEVVETFDFQNAVNAVVDFLERNPLPIRIADYNDHTCPAGCSDKDAIRERSTEVFSSVNNKNGAPTSISHNNRMAKRMPVNSDPRDTYDLLSSTMQKANLYYADDGETSRNLTKPAADYIDAFIAEGVEKVNWPYVMRLAADIDESRNRQNQPGLDTNDISVIARLLKQFSDDMGESGFVWSIENSEHTRLSNQISEMLQYYRSGTRKRLDQISEMVRASEVVRLKKSSKEYERTNALSLLLFGNNNTSDDAWRIIRGLYHTVYGVDQLFKVFGTNEVKNDPMGCMIFTGRDEQGNFCNVELVIEDLFWKTASDKKNEPFFRNGDAIENIDALIAKLLPKQSKIRKQLQEANVKVEYWKDMMVSDPTDESVRNEFIKAKVELEKLETEA